MAPVKSAALTVGIRTASTAAYPGYLKRIELHGSEGSAVLEEEDLRKWDFAKPTRSDKAIVAAMQTTRGTGAMERR